MALTEDEVRNEASKILGFNNDEERICQGTGQITTFNRLGFSGVKYKPDGWYLPENLGLPAIILEVKAQNVDIAQEKCKNELIKNIGIVEKKYNKVIGILYNGVDVRVFRNHDELNDVSKSLESKHYYISLFSEEKLDKEHIYEVTKRINDCLHFKFGMTDLQDRMIFTACALVAQRYNPMNGLKCLKGMQYEYFQDWIKRALTNAIADDIAQNDKLNMLVTAFTRVNMSITTNQVAINAFIDDVCEIADLLNSDNWNGEDVMAIFFNEFNRYRAKSDAGQIFTPDHVTSFMYRLIDVRMTDKVLDATCGSGAFLVKAMCNMIREAGGVNTEDAKLIKSSRLYGIELYDKIFALACANMLIHKDGKTNLLQADASSEEAAQWIESKSITKVLMNPPYEKKYRCAAIVLNVLNSVPEGTKCAILLPDKKLEKDAGFKGILSKHTIETIVKMPENLFLRFGVTTSIFVFVAKRPQNDCPIIGYYMADDGLETVKNKGRQDTRNKWQDIEDYWIHAISVGSDDKYGTKQEIKPSEHLSYQMPAKSFEISEEDFKKTMLDRLMYEKDINNKEIEDNIINSVSFSGEIEMDPDSEDVSIVIRKERMEHED